MYKIRKFIENTIDDMDAGLKLVIVGVLLFGSCIFTFSSLEYGICKNLQSVYENTDNVKYTWPAGCLVKTPSGYWVHYDDLNGLELIDENN